MKRASAIGLVICVLVLATLHLVGRPAEFDREMRRSARLDEEFRHRRMIELNKMLKGP